MLSVSPNLEIKTEIIRSLGTIRDSVSIPLLIDLYKKEKSKEMKIEIIKTIESIQKKAPKIIFQLLLEEKNTEMQIELINSLCILKTKIAYKHFMKNYYSINSERLKQIILDYLSIVGNLKTFGLIKSELDKEIEKYKNDDNKYSSRQNIQYLIRLIGNLRYKEVATYLLSLIKLDDIYIKREIILTLGTFSKDDTIVNFMDSFLRKEYENIRETIFMKEIVEILFKKASNEIKLNLLSFLKENNQEKLYEKNLKKII